MDSEETLHLDPSDCIFIADTLDEIANRQTHFDGCDICFKYKRHGTSPEKIQHHVKGFHCNLAVCKELKDGRKVFTLPCRRGCMVRGGANGKRSHYHCPFCTRMCGRRNNMLNHFKINCSNTRWKTSQRQPPAYCRVQVTDDASSHDELDDDLEELTPPAEHDHVALIMEKRLSEWIKDQKAFGRTVNMTSMLQKARALYDKSKADLGIRKTKPFYAGKQWVKSFLERYGMRDTTVVAVDESERLKLPEKDVILKIIERVAEKQALYDPLVAALQDHSSESEEDIWNEIAASIGLESGIVVKQIWNSVERKYHERMKPGLNPSEPWEYEHYLKFLPTEIMLEAYVKLVFSNRHLFTLSFMCFIRSDIGGETVVCTSASTASQGSKDLVTVTIQGDHDFAGDEFEQYPALSDRRVNAAKLRKIHLEMETIQREHEVRMEMLAIQKSVLLKKLQSMN